MAAKKVADPMFSFDQTSVASERNNMYWLCGVPDCCGVSEGSDRAQKIARNLKGGERQSKRELSELAASPAGRPTVLCINDIPQALELRRATLGSHGYCVKIASSGHTAVKILEVAAVLLEYKLGMDVEAVAGHIEQPNEPRPHRLKSELPERLVAIISGSTLKAG